MINILQFIVNLKINSLALVIAYVIIYKFISSVYSKIAQTAIYREDENLISNKKESA